MRPDRPATDDGSLDAVLRCLGALRDGVAGRAGGDGWEAWAEATSPRGIAAWLDEVRGGDPAGERPAAVAASFLIGWAASAVLAPGVAVAASGRCPDLDQDALLVRRAPGGWIEGVCLRSGPLGRARPDAPGEFGRRAHLMLAPLVEALAAASPLSPRTLWGGVIDAGHIAALRVQDAGVGYAGALNLWKVAGEVADAIALDAGLGGYRRPCPFTSGDGESPRLCCRRATCCLAYRSPSGAARRTRGEESRCAGCPLRSM